MLRVHHLTTGYGKKQVLNDISFEINKGDITLLTGGNGSGKSTVLRAIYGLLPPWEHEDGTSSKIIFNGKDITNSPPFQLLNMGMAYMPQKKNIFDVFTVEENLLTAANIYSKEDARTRSNNVFALLPELSKLRRRTPFSMSGGEKQLLAMGCVLLHSPQLLLLDEPFAGVDEKNCVYLLNIIKRINKEGGTFIIVEHKRHLFDNIEYKEIELNLGVIKQH